MKFGIQRLRANPVFVLFIVWGSSGERAPQLIRTILDTFSLVDISEFSWPTHEVLNQLSHLYDLPPEKLHHKDREIGSGSHTAILGIDWSPRYTWSERKKGYANIRAHHFKMSQRQGGENFLHASDTELDAIKFAAALFGHSPQKLLNFKELALQNFLNGPPTSLGEILERFNKSINYVVLRNWDNLPGGFVAGHNDVDFLVDCFPAAACVLPGLHKEHPDARHFDYIMNLRDSFFKKPLKANLDLSRVGDNIYAEPWQRDLLSRRVQDKRGFYRIHDDDIFWTLLYHVLYYKREITRDYREQLLALGSNIGGWCPSLLDDKPRARKFLAIYYPVTKPKAGTLYWDAD